MILARSLSVWGTEWGNEKVSVRFQAFVDPLSKRLKCTFKTFDKTTGEVPQAASLGFLYPKNGSNGQGFFRFKIKLSRTIQHFDCIQINSSIIFDNEETIVKNNLIYTIDKESPKLELEWNKNENYLFLNGTDNGSGVRNILIYDKTDLLLNANEYLYKLTFESNREYEIFYTVEDNVGNILDRVYFGKINTHFLKFCPSNCSSNSACNTTYGVCECFQNYFGDDCSKTIDELDQSLTVLLNNLNVQLQFRQTTIRNLYDFEVYILTQGIVSLKVINLPKEILFLNGI